MIANPIDFDIWCKLKADATKVAAAWTTKIHPITIIDAFKSVRDSQLEDGHVQIFVGQGWDDIPKLIQTLPDFVQKDSCVVTESSYRPSDCPHYCEKHLLRHISRTCPICDGFYISHIIDGKRFAPKVK